MENVVLIPLGMLFAAFASLVGVGGGLFWATYLILIRGFNPQDAVVYSFLFQIVGMSSAMFTNIKKGNIFWSLTLKLLPFVIIGIMIGAFLNQRLANPAFLQAVLGVTCIIISIFFAFQTDKYDEDLRLDTTIKPTTKLRAQTLSFASLSGLLSIGIGDFLVPILRGKWKLPMRYAIGSCLFLNLFAAISGSISNIFLSGREFRSDMLEILIFGWIGVFIGGQIGPRLMVIVDDSRIKEIFIFVLLMMGIHLIYKSL